MYLPLSSKSRRVRNGKGSRRNAAASVPAQPGSAPSRGETQALSDPAAGQAGGQS